MSISSVSLDQGMGSSLGRSSVRQARQDFDQLFQALQSGDLATAQQAYGNFQQIQTGLTDPSATAATAVSAASTANPVLSDWSALGQALQAGSLSSAQSALGKLEQDASTAWQSRIQNAQSVYALMQGSQPTAVTSGATAVNATSQATPVQNDLSSLSQALQSGDSSAAQKLLAQLEQDLQASEQSSGGHHHHHHHGGGLSGLNAASAYSSTASSGSTAATGSTGATASIGTGAVAPA
jgi:hypothetical protein